MTKEYDNVENALQVLWASPIGKAVMRDLRDHASTSKPTQEKLDELERRQDRQLVYFIGLFLTFMVGSGLVNWQIIDRTFAGYFESQNYKISSLEKDYAEVITILNDNNLYKK